jgi:predicted 3-demethylubiquinone-9 3-methyltransferase (glyoxalase superfamily)
MTTRDERIVTHLWFDHQAVEAAGFYCALLPESGVTGTTTLHGTPSGDCDVVSFDLAGRPFMAISAGPHFRFNPSISFILNFDPSREADARGNLDRLWEALSEGGTPLMPLGEYPFSEHYGWIQDRYGLSWQLMLTDPAGEPRPFLTPSLLFVGEVCGRAEEAIEHYLSAFDDARRGVTVRYPAGMEPEREGTLMYADFVLEGSWFAAMDSAQAHDFAFNEAVSFLVRCDTQEEIDRYWEALTAEPQAERCGWLKDRFGVSWQVAPREMGKMLEDGDSERAARVTEAFLGMGKLDLAALRSAAAGSP